MGAEAAAATQVAGGVMSLIEADKQSAAKQEADKAAAAAAAEAKKQLSQNFFQGLQLPMEAYDRSMREATAQQMQALSAMQEIDPRALAGGVGRLQMAGNDYLANEREQLANKLFELEKIKAAASKDVAENLGEFEMQRAKGAQMASMAAEKARVASMQQAFNQFGNAAVGVEGALNPTYKTVNLGLESEKTTIPSSEGVTSNLTGVNASLESQLAALGYKAVPIEK